MRNKLFFSAIALATLMAACNSGSNTKLTTRVELPGTIDEEAFAANVESISVVNLQMDDNWAISDSPKFDFADNYIYFSEDRQIRLVCFDRQTGEKISDRIIKGRGPGEITFLNSLFCIGDTLCVCTAKGIKQYDHNFRFLGDLYEYDSQLYGYQSYRLNNDNYALLYSPFSIVMDTVSVIFLTDKSFNIKSKHFTAQPTMATVYGKTPSHYVKGDTIRCFLPHDNHLYTLCGDNEQIIELAVPNPLTNEALKDAEDPFSKSFEYDGLFGALCESGRFVAFSYNFKYNEYTSMLDKRTNNIVSISYKEEPVASTSDIVVDFFNSIAILKTHGNYIYARCKIRNMNKIIEGHDDLLDKRLKKTQAEYRAYLERNAEYLKGLDDDERNAATVLLKIKLKD